MNKISILTLSVLFFLLQFTDAARAQDRKFVNEFLNLGVGARAQGMMGAMVAHNEDITAAYWNPAGLSDIQAPFQVGAMHAEWFAGIAQYDYIGFGKSLGKKGRSYAGLSLIRLGIDQIPNTFNLIGPDGRVNYDNITEFSATDYALLLSFGQKFGSTFQAGGSIKVLNRSIGQWGNAWGFGFDIGIRQKLKGFQWGVMARDIPSTFTAWSFNYTEEEKEILYLTGNDIPKSSTEVALPQIIAGIAYVGGAEKGEKGISYILEADINISGNSTVYSILQTETVDAAPAFGMELGYNHLVYLRAGIGNLQQVSKDFETGASFNYQPNLGVGLALGRIKVDYALTNVGNIGVAEYSHILSLVFDVQSERR